VIDGNPHLVDIVESVVREQTIPIFSDRLEFRGSELGPQAGVIGAASLARRRLQERSAA
jgi:hypothetical protein